MQAGPTRRQEQVLKHIIEEYVVSAQPVSSEAIARRYETPVSSATIRNEMAALQEAGFLVHPHASAGRVPSDVGYRHYVQYLMEDARLSETEERTILHQFHQVESDIEEWVRLAAAVLASFLQTSVVAVPPVAQTSRLRRLDLIEMGPGRLLVVAIFKSGAVRQQLVSISETVSPAEVRQLSERLNHLLYDRSAKEVQELRARLGATPLLDILVRLLEEEDRWQNADVYVEGLSHIARQPEFGSVERLGPVVELLEHPRSLGLLLEPRFQAEGVQVSIGREQPLEALRECATILGTYGRPGDLAGVVGVIGPTRLPYWRAVPMVQYVAGLLDRLLEGSLLR